MNVLLLFAIICNLKLMETYLDSIKIFQFLKYTVIWIKRKNKNT